MPISLIVYSKRKYNFNSNAILLKKRKKIYSLTTNVLAILSCHPCLSLSISIQMCPNSKTTVEINYPINLMIAVS